MVLGIPRALGMLDKLPNWVIAEALSREGVRKAHLEVGHGEVFVQSYTQHRLQGMRVLAT